MNKCKRCICIIMSVLFVTVARGAPTDFVQTISEVMQKYSIPASAYAVMQNGEIVACGGVNANEDTVFQCASIAKSLCGILVERLEQNGARIHNAHAILNHYNRAASHAGDALLLFGAELHRMREANQAFNANSAPLDFSYSNLAFAQLQYDIEILTGMPYSQALRYYVLDPLGITSHDSSAAISGHIMAEGAVRQADNQQAMYTLPAATGFDASAKDLSRLLLYMKDLHPESMYETGVENLYYSNGFYVLKTEIGNIVYARATAFGTESLVAVLQGSGRGIALAANGSPAPVDLLMRQFFGLPSEDYSVDAVPLKKAALLNLGDQFAHQYHNDIYGPMTLIYDKKTLTISLDDFGRQYQLERYSGGLYRVKGADGQLASFIQGFGDVVIAEDLSEVTWGFMAIEGSGKFVRIPADGQP